MKKIVVFASGNGSNFQAILEQLHQQHCQISLLVCDNPAAYCLERASRKQIATFVAKPQEYDSKEVYELEIGQVLLAIDPDLIVLAGYMRIIGHTLISQFSGKIINIHPSLLPAFPGRNGIQDALKYGVKVMGVTIHYVDDGIDTGKIIDQISFKVNGSESVSEIEKKIHELEHEHYPQVIKRLLQV